MARQGLINGGLILEIWRFGIGLAGEWREGEMG